MIFLMEAGSVRRNRGQDRARDTKKNVRRMKKTEDDETESQGSSGREEEDSLD